MTAPFRVVVFDFDGTLADSFPWFLKAINELAQRYRFPGISPTQIPLLRSMSSSQILTELAIPAWRVPLIGRDLRRLMSEAIGEIRFFPELARYLEMLADSGIRLAVVSSNSLENVKTVLGPTLAERVDHFDCGVALQGKSARLHRLVRREGIRADEVLFVGDEIRDVRAAKEAGVASGVVTWGYNDEESLVREAPDHVFQQPSDLAVLLPKHLTSAIHLNGS